MLSEPRMPSAPRSVAFRLTADSSPGLLPRLLEPFARRDLTPDRVTARRQGSAMLVEIALAAMPDGILHLVEGNLRQVVGVRALERDMAASPATAMAAAA